MFAPASGRLAEIERRNADLLSANIRFKQRARAAEAALKRAREEMREIAILIADQGKPAAWLAVAMQNIDVILRLAKEDRA
jgi:hypothetical protein